MYGVVKSAAIIETSVSVLVRRVEPMSFTGGKLKLKGSSSDGSKKKKKRKVSNETEVEEESSLRVPSSSSSSSSSSVTAMEVKSTELKPEDYLTKAEIRFLRKKEEVDARTAKEVVKTTYRERVENFNVRLATATEHNDIPRISAAGNG